MKSGFFACIAVLFVSGIAFSQHWPVVNTIPNHVDAYSPLYTAGTNGDMCAAINNAILAANGSSPHTSLVVDARGFTGVRGCESNPFHGANVSVKLLLGASTAILTSITWYSPAVTFRIEGELAGNIAISGGTTIVGSGPDCGGITMGTVTYNSSTHACTFTDNDNNSMSVPVLSTAGGAGGESSSYYVTFGVNHDPLPAGNYYPIIVMGGQGSSEKSGFDSDSDAWMLSHLKIDLGGNTGSIGVYSLNNQERTIINDVRIGFACGTAVAGGVTPVNCVGVMGDRVEYSAGTVTSGVPARAGSTRMSIEHFNFAGELAQDCASCYGIVYNGSPIAIDLSSTGCVGSAAYVNQSLTGGAFNVNSPSTQISVSAAGASCGASGTACHITGPPTAGYGTGDNTSAGCTIQTDGSGHLTFINVVTTGGANYPNSQVTGGPMLFDINCAGDVSPTGRVEACFWEEGTINTQVSHLHVINPIPGTYAIERGVTELCRAGFLPMWIPVGTHCT